MANKQTEYISTDYCVLPRFITADNMFDGYQYYITTEHILGITDNIESWEKVRIYNYDNPIFKGTLSFQHNYIHGSILTHANVNGKNYFSCNGICEPERSTQILDICKKAKEFSGKEYPSKNDFERYMFMELQKL